MRSQALLFGALAITAFRPICQAPASQTQKKMFCYYTSWSQFRKVPLFPEHIQPDYCTHLVFAFAKLSGNSLATVEWNDITFYNPIRGLYYRFNQLKTQNSSLKTLLAVGGWAQGSESFSATASTGATRSQFARSTVKYLRDHDFDGLDIDWVYPADKERGGRPEDKVNFALLVRELRTVFNTEVRSSGKSRLLLTAAVAAGYDKVERGYDIPSLNRDLDFIGIMAYDLHGSWENRTGHSAGLFTSSTDPLNMSVSAVAENWAHGGADRRKLLVGLPLYGRTWTLADPRDTKVGAASVGPGKADNTSDGVAGTLNYSRICVDLRQHGYTRKFDMETKNPYAYSGNQWISYDNQISLQYKMCWLRENGYGGSIVWNLDGDDFHGDRCGSGVFPLVRTIHQCLVQNYNCTPADGASVEVAPTTQPPRWPWSSNHPVTVNTTAISSTMGIPSATDPDCPSYEPGKLFRDRFNCSAFWMCLSPRQKFQFPCPSLMVFDPRISRCNHLALVDCKTWAVP